MWVVSRRSNGRPCEREVNFRGVLDGHIGGTFYNKVDLLTMFFSEGEEGTVNYSYLLQSFGLGLVLVALAKKMGRAQERHAARKPLERKMEKSEDWTGN